MAKQSGKQQDNPRDNSRREGSSDLQEKVLYINRCSKTVKGGRKMSFSALILVGDGKGRVGYGFAKANELTDAIKKGGELARKNMITCTMDETTLPYDASSKWDGALVYMRPAKPGTGIVAGSKVRAILEFAGYKDVMAKTLGSSSPNNIVRATFQALENMKSKEAVLKERE